MIIIISPVLHVTTCDLNVEEKIKKARQGVHDGRVETAAVDERGREHLKRVATVQLQERMRVHCVRTTNMETAPI